MAARAYHKPNNVEILECQPPPGAKITMMMFYAKRAAKEEMKAQGIRVAYIHPREVRRRAEELLRDRWEEFERLAQPVLLKISAKFRSDAQRKKRSNRKTIPVQISGAK